MCQGAATHYVKPAEYPKLKDFDIWHFYVEVPSVRFPYRSHKRLQNGYLGRQVDFLKRAIPKAVADNYRGAPSRIIMEYLKQGDTETKRRLLKKVIICLYPD
ncbi:MAG: hypothetical protein ACRECH_14710, partial [Nitrososphaerales archaeon]